MITWTKYRPIAYWIVTVLLVLETITGAFWDLLKVPAARDPLVHLGYPDYLLVILGVWKLLAVIALLVPRFAIVKEWAYAGIFFEMTGAIASHLAAGDGFSTWAVAAVFALVIIASWAWRPASRRTGASLFGKKAIS
jgi:hypothetical protein